MSKIIDLDNDNRTIRVTFTVICESSVCMQIGDNLNDRINHYTKMCTEAMEEEMRHWGDHETFIDPIKTELISCNENGEKIIEEIDE